MKDFADLHHHSENSLLDGMGSVDRHVKRCLDLGHTAVALTEHGTNRGFVSLDAACEKHKIKPVFGCEVYVTRDHMRQGLTDEQVAAVTAGLKGAEKKAAKAGLEEAEGTQERRHLVLLAENDEGLRNLIRLQNRANTHGFYHKPRVDLQLLEQYNEGVIVNSGCIGGVLAQSFFAGDTDRVLDDLEWFIDVFGDRFSLEIQPHPIDMQEEWNKFVLRLSEEYDVPLVAANDSHYPAPDDWRAHDTLVCVGTNKKVHDCERLHYEAETFGLKSADDMIEAFARVHPYMPRSVVESAIERSAEIAERCSAKLWKPSGVLLPTIEHTEDDGEVKHPADALQDLCVAGWKWREISKRARKHGGKAYADRLVHELDVIEGKGFSNYFLIVHELLNWSRSKGILTGPGRGSAAGSLVCYLLGITSLDPVEHGLLFERFLTPGRVDWPDIDCDIEKRRRPEVLQHLRDQYGEDCVAQISTVSRMRARAAFKDVARAHGINPATVESLTTAIVDEKTRIDPGDSHETLRKAVESTPALQRFEAVHPDVVEHGIRLEGHMRHVGIHPSGIVTSPTPLADFVPLERRKSGSNIIIVTAYDMRDCETVGLIKLDILGLTTLSVIADATRLIDRRHGVKVDLEALPFDDEEALDSFTDHDFAGIFQFDTPSSRGACRGVIFDSFEDIVAMNALNRPGPSQSGLADEWRKRKLAGRWKPGHETIERICADTLGVIVYQEHVIRILQDLAGYSPEEAGRLRKAISKSKGVGYLETERPTFVAGAMKGGMTEDEADTLWTQIEEFGAYGFNKCLIGNTILSRAGVNQHTKSQGPLTVERLFEIQGERSPIGDKFRAGRMRILQMDDDGRIRPGVVRAVYENGPCEVFRVTVASGRAIDATSNHRLLTADGYRTVDEIAASWPNVSLVCLGDEPVYFKKGRLPGRKGPREKERGFPKGRANPGWIDGRQRRLNELRAGVALRAAGQCEECGTGDSPRFECAHTQSLEQCDGDYGRYHHLDNARWLCNSCHKRFDYAKGERKKAWSKGKPTGLDKVVSVEALGVRRVYDVEMATTGHNFIANGIVSHNSHSAAYSLIAYWGQWLKVNYPIEFFCGLLMNESDTDKANRFVREASRREIKISPPDINASKRSWSTRGSSLLTGIEAIKKCGEKACTDIEKHAPFKDFPDFVSRINRRVVNKGVIAALIKAGALRSLMPNTKFAIEQFEAILKKVGNKGWAQKTIDALAASAEEPDYSDDDLWCLRLEVGINGDGRHPLGAVSELFKSYLRPGFVQLADSTDGSWVAGVIAARRVGTSRGERWAAIELEDEVGDRVKIRFGDAAYAEHREVLDSGVGTIVAANIAVNKYGNVKPVVLVNLLEIRKARQNGDPLSEEQVLLVPSLHPARAVSKSIRSDWWRDKNNHVLVVNVNVRRDVNRRKFAFVRVDSGLGNTHEVVVFADAFEACRRFLKPGRIVNVKAKKEKKGSLIATAVNKVT